MRRRLALDAGTLDDAETPVTSVSCGPMLKAKPPGRRPAIETLRQESKRAVQNRETLAQLERLAHDSTLTQPERNLAYRAAGRIRKPPLGMDTRELLVALRSLTDQALLAALAELNLP